MGEVVQLHRAVPERLLINLPATPEGVLVKAISLVQAYLPPDSGISKEQALDRLLEILDGPEAVQVYNRIVSKQAPPRR